MKTLTTATRLQTSKYPKDLKHHEQQTRFNRAISRGPARFDATSGTFDARSGGNHGATGQRQRRDELAIVAARPCHKCGVADAEFEMCDDTGNVQIGFVCAVNRRQGGGAMTTINVTQTDIDAGGVNHCNCPVARAVERTLADWLVPEVGYTHVSLFDDTKSGALSELFLPDSAQRFIARVSRHHDAGSTETLEPFSFELDLPAWALREVTP